MIANRPGSGQTRILLALILAMFGFPLVAGAQISSASASINGTVRDPSGGVIPTATVVLTNADTAVKRETITNNSGNYVLLNIPPGKYNLEATKQGFASMVQEGITLYVNQTATFDFNLSVGSEKQAITVEATAVVVEASTAELGEVVNTQQVDTLPLNGRNFTELLILTTGASPINISQNSGGWSASPIGAATFPSMNGQRNRSNFFMLDGTNDQGSTVSTYAVPPIIDAVQEFKVQSHNDEAQFGEALGGIINVVTKSGTNQFHGDLWDFLRNSALDARNTFVPAVTPLQQNQFGGTVGGPIIAPHFNGRDKAFFFASYQGFRNRSPSETLFLIPTAQELNGDFSQVGTTIYNPFSTRPDPANPGQYLRDAFPNNDISSKLYAPAVLWAKTFFPQPIDTGVPGTNGRDNTPNTTRQDEVNLRLDYRFGDKDMAFVRYSGLAETITGSGGFQGLHALTFHHSYQAAASWTHTFSGSAVAQFSFARNTVQENNDTLFTDKPPGIVGQLGFTNFARFHGGLTLLPQIGIVGYVGESGEGVSTNHFSNIYEWKGDFSKLYGRHTFRMGADFATNWEDAVQADSIEDFASFETFNLETSAGGDAAASFLMGIPDDAFYQGSSFRQTGSWVDGFYFQDQWKATQKLTVNVGVRWDFTLLPAWGVGTVDFNNGTYVLTQQFPACSASQPPPCIPGGALPTGAVVSPKGRLMNNQLDNVQPRLGLAYRLTNKTVLRGSYGRFFENWAATSQFISGVDTTWPQTGGESAGNLNAVTPTNFMLDPLNLGSGAQFPPAANPYEQLCQCNDPNWQDGRSDQWNLGFQRQLDPSTTLTMNYVGSADTRLSLGGQYNTSLTPGPGVPQTRNLFPLFRETSYDRSWGKAFYHALQVSLDKKTAKGLTYLLAYTWGKNIDYCGEYFQQGCSPQDPYNMRNEKGISDEDLPQIFSLSWVYSVPFGRGQRWSTGSKVGDYIIGNWKIDGIVSLSNGQPYYVGIRGDIANTGNRGNNGFTGFYERLNLTGQPFTPADRTPDNWLNTAAFSVPAPFTFGDEARNILRTDWRRNLDFSISRDFPLPFRDTTKLQFRFDAFNLTNTPVYGIPTRNYADPTFGQVTSTANVERQLQFALKFYF